MTDCEPTSVARRMQELAAQAELFAGRSTSRATQAAYESDLRQFRRWCDDNEQPFPPTPEAVGCYLVDLGDWAAPSTISRRVSAISFWHRELGVQDPTKDPWVRRVHAGLRRSRQRRPRQAEALRLQDLRKMLETLPADDRGVRDRAVLLTGWWGALRRSELSKLEIGDLRRSAAGYSALVRRSKVDQEGLGREIALPRNGDPVICPVEALDDWLDRPHDTRWLFPSMDRWGNVQPGPMSTAGICRLVKRVADDAGCVGHFSAHSLRAGFVTEAAAVASEADIAFQSGHRSTAVLRGYIRAASLFERNAATTLARAHDQDSGSTWACRASTDRVAVLIMPPDGRRGGESLLRTRRG